jgi:hypothetical protein
MKRFLSAFFVLSFMACNTETTTPETEPSAEPQANVPANLSGFTPSYSVSFVMDDAANTEKVIALWADWRSGDLSQTANYFADSVTIVFADGNSVSGTSDDVLKIAQEVRNSYKGMEVGIAAAFAVKSTDRDEHWVSIWGSEIQTDASGKVDTISLQESWRFNQAGKADLMLQSARKGIYTPPATDQ